MRVFGLLGDFDEKSTISINVPEEIFNKVHRIIVNDKSSKKSAIFYEEDDNYGSKEEN